MIGIALLTFGSAVTADDVPAYLQSVRSGREVPVDVVQEFQRRYRRIGRSPLVDITLEQGAALQALLDAEHGPGAFSVEVGMLHSEPRVAAAIDRLIATRPERVIAVVLAPQYSPIILAGYERAVDEARRAHADLAIDIAGAWHTTSEWIGGLSGRLTDAVERLPAATRDNIPIIFTAHSLPRAVVDRDPGYIDQLRETADSVAQRAGLPAERWSFAYQSAGHTPEEWLTPDVKDLLPGLAERGVKDVVVVPLQFVADHLEILYDIDVAAAEEAREHGITLHRIELPNTSPAFIRALAAVVHRELSVGSRAKSATP
jgi:protoporphyrin/coproporphyrin ferrochelatase